ncbi:MAG: glycoside hydrolase family 30 protein [Acholeplasmataceae bacterium]
MKLYRTCQSTNEWLEDVTLQIEENNQKLEVIIDPKQTLQTIIGFGGAFTEAAVYNLSRIDKEKRKLAMKAYFDPIKGLGYTMGRVSIHGCDFSLGSYLYIKDGDDTLDTFNISRDQQIIDCIKDASKYAKQDIKILASPWTPPFWMKDNQSPIRGGKLLTKYDQTWANYFVKFIKAYKQQGIDIFAVTVQNEPMASQRWDSCIYENEDELRFVKVLGKTFEKANLQNVKIYIWDHNRDLMLERATAVLSDPLAYRYVYGTAFHWYDQELFDEVRKTHEAFPDKHLLFSEGCQEGGPHLHEYSVGERYGRNILNDLRNFNEAYIDWNLFLDETGGPNHVNNLCSSPIVFKIFQEEVIKNPSYYYIGHFSKYIRPGAIQLKSYGDESISYVVFKNIDQSIVIVMMNEKDIKYNIEIKGLENNIYVSILSHSIQTIII